MEELNSQQREAVEYCEGHSLIIAGAGSGKTKVLTHKIAYLLNNDYQPFNVLALTFTNKAAKEMVERIAKLLGNNLASSLWCGTFHSIFSRILRREAANIGFDSNFTIYDQQDVKKIIKRIIVDLKLDEKVYKEKVICNRISWAKNNLLLPHLYKTNDKVLKYDKDHSMPEICMIYDLYMKRCKDSNALDFDDLLLYTYLLFKSNQNIKSKYIDRFKYLLVDEYQDTNNLQFNIIKLLIGNDTKLCVVGDDAQSIYRFRGAEIGNILAFTNVFPQAKIFKLERNYRSTQNIVNAANSVISHNKSRIPKHIYSENQIGDKIKIYEAISDKEEAYKVLKEINRLKINKNLNYNDIAILYRTNSQSRSFEDVFRVAKIPYQIYGGLSFYQRKEIKDILAYYKIVCNRFDDESLLRIINYPARGIGETTIKKIRFYAIQNNERIWTILSSIDNSSIDLNNRIKNKIKVFVNKIEEYTNILHKKKAYDLALQILQEVGIFDEIKSHDKIEAQNKIQNVYELLNAIKEFSNETLEEEGLENMYLDQYLPQIALLTDQDNESEEDKVSLMTIHAAKGLEFDAVFVTGLEENLFPSQQSLFDQTELEEERRLFYVAMTRAKRYCILSHANSRFHFGKNETCNPSIFLGEIDKDYIEKEPLNTLLGSSRIVYSKANEKSLKRISTSDSISSDTSKNFSEEFGIKVKSKIIHERFGLGEIIKIEGEGNETKATILFENVGEKKLLMKYAKYKLAEKETI